jgi:hypothetical protein
MADPADTAADTHAETGQEPTADVGSSGNDAFGAAFEAFASGKAPAPEVDEQAAAGDVEDDAGQDGADEGGEQPPAEGADRDPPANAGAKPAAGTEPPDPWAGASPELIAARDKMREEMQRKIDGASGRASGLQRRINELTAGAGVKPADKLPEQSDKPNAWKALDDKIKGLKEDYPEIADVLIPLLEAQRDELADLHGKVAPVIEADSEQVIVSQQRALEDKHPDWREFGPGGKAEADFDGWINTQPESVRKLSDSFDAREVAVALTLFKTERAEAQRRGGGGAEPATPKPSTATDARRARQLDGGKVVTSRATSAATGAPDDFAGAFDHFAAKRTAKR